MSPIYTSNWSLSADTVPVEPVPQENEAACPPATTVCPSQLPQETEAVAAIVGMTRAAAVPTVPLLPAP